MEQFDFIKGYQKEDIYRKSFNSLAKKTFGIDFEQWYQQGNWGNSYIPFSFAKDEQIVSNVSVSVMDFISNGKKLHTIQLGAVMTMPEYRGKGLSRMLIERVMKEYKQQCDFIFLFANQSVLDFYPKFGFKPFLERQSVFQPCNAACAIRKLNLCVQKDNAIFTRLVKNHVPVSKALSMIDSVGLIWFYVFNGHHDHLYYLPEEDAALILEEDESKCILLDIYASVPMKIETILEKIGGNQPVILGFTADFQSETAVSVQTHQDNLFVYPVEAFPLGTMVPLLAHT